MLFLLWLTIRLLTRLLVLPNADDGTKDLEILVLRHQLRVLRRKTGRPRFTSLDRIVLAATSACFPETAGHHSSSRRRRCCAGTANSSDASGPTRRDAGPADHQSTPRLLCSSCGWPERTRDGAASGSAGSSASSASEWAPPRSGRCCDATGWVRRHDAAGPHGHNF